MALQDFDRIETPENVELELPLAGIGSRFIAGLIDTLILGGTLLVLGVALLLFGGLSFDGIAENVSVDGWIVAVASVVLFVVYWGYFWGFEATMNGQTPGKRIMRVRVVKEGGAAIGFVDCAVRNLLRVVDGLGAYSVAGAFMFVSKRGQRLGDLAAGTLVVSEQSTDYSAQTDKRVVQLWEVEASANALRVTGLSPEEFRALTSYWLRRDQLSLEARNRVLPRLLEPVLQRAGRSASGMAILALEAEVEHLITRANVGQADGKTAP